MRVLPEEIEFAIFLIDVGNETFNDANDCIEISEHCIIRQNGCTVQEVFGKLIAHTYLLEMLTLTK